REMRAQGMIVHEHVIPSALREHARLKALVAADGREFTGFDTVLWAVGRAPHVAGLDLERAGVAQGSDATITTDEFQNTNVQGVYAIGDVTGRAALTPVAI